MCGIYGYVGQPTHVLPIVAEALRTMEYRGYDSWGIAWDDGRRLSSWKQPGRVPGAVEAGCRSALAIGHTRWATHGRVTAENAHPHIDPSGQIGVVHNGVIENISELRASLAPGVFVSETDSEVVPHLVAAGLASGFSFPRAVRHAFDQLRGNNAIVVAHQPSGAICAITSRSPLRLGRRPGSWVLASDPLALAGEADEMAVIPDNTLVTIGIDGVTFGHGEDGLSPTPDWSAAPTNESVRLGPYPHFTLKEIHDQPAMLEKLVDRAADVIPLAHALRSYRHVLVTGCGSAYYAALLGVETLRLALPDTWIDVVPASEIDQATRHMGTDTLMLVLSQSGETADVIDAIHTARGWGAGVAALVNTTSSTVANVVDTYVPLLAGTERSVLATKSFVAMAMRLLQLADCIGGTAHAEGDAMRAAISDMRQLLDCDRINELANRIALHDHVITLGKGPGHRIAMEAALKIKEGSYVHGEAFLTGELKHGPLALVGEGTPCLVFATTPEDICGAGIASHEVGSRGGYVVGFGAFEPGDCSTIVRIEDRGPATSLVHVAAAQLLAYGIAVARGVNPDYPRNLAKSVTVR